MRPPVVLVLRGDDEFSATLRGNGCEVVNLELIRTEPVDDPGKLRDKLTQIADLDGLFFTSPVAATIFLEALRTAGANVGGKIYVLGRRTKEVFENAGLDVEYKNDANTAEDLIDLFGEAEFKGKRLLFVRGDKSMGTIPALLDGKAAMEEMIVYRTLANVPDPPIVAEIRRRLHESEIDWMCFFSPSGIENFLSAVGSYPMGYTHMLMSLLFVSSKASEIVIVGEKADSGVQRLVNAVNKSFLPYSVVVFKDIKGDQDISEYVSYIEGHEMVKDQATAYICENFACRAPVTDAGEFEKMIH
jgi:uroporphyrinogen-III synthase